LTVFARQWYEGGMTLEGWHRRVVLALAIALAAVGAAPGCGPIQYTSTVTYGADNALEAARAVNAAKWSPYWWTRATQYLHKSREEAAGSNWEASNHFGRLARDAARKARDEAIRRAADPAAAAKEMGPIGGAPAGGAGLAPALDDDGPAAPAPARDDDAPAPAKEQP
jgi:hypothetical protein